MNEGTGWYQGDCHAHSAASNGGELTPQQLLAAARGAGLDSIVVTRAQLPLSAGWSEAGSGSRPAGGTGSGGDHSGRARLALGLRPGQVVDWRYGAADGAIDRRPAEVRGGGGLCVAEHPFGIGEALTVGDESGAVVRAEPQGVPVGTVSLHAAKGRVRGAAPPRTGADTVEWRVGAAEAAQALFARAEVRDAEGAVAALTNPVLLEPRR